MRICERAMGGRHLEVVKWATKQGCPWSIGARMFAALTCDWELLRLARELGFPCPESSSWLLHEKLHPEFVQWLREWHSESFAP